MCKATFAIKSLSAKNKVQEHPLLFSVGLMLHLPIGVRAGGARGAAALPNFGQLRFFGNQEKIWAKPFFKDVLFFFY